MAQNTTIKDIARALGISKSTVSRALAEECPVPMRFVGMDDRFGKSGEFEELLAYFGLDSKAIVKAVKSLTLK